MRISDWSSDVCSSDLPVTWIYVDSRGRDLQGLVQDIQRAIARDVKLPPSVSVSYTGQFEFLVRATERMKIVVPVTLAIILVLLYLTFRRWDEALLIDRNSVLQGERVFVRFVHGGFLSIILNI